MLTGMTPPPGGRDEDKARERRLARSGGAGDGAGETAEPDDEAEARSQKLHEDDQTVNNGMETVHGWTPEQVRRADQLEERSYQHVQRAKHEASEAHDRAASAHDRAAEAHGRAAQLHDRQADLGWGNVEEHREQAHEHREYEEADRAEADHDRDEYRGDSSEQPTPPAGPHTGWPPRR
jgi:hypothetical protein